MITILIQGSAKSGKSIVLREVAEQLTGLGCIVTIGGDYEVPKVEDLEAAEFLTGLAVNIVEVPLRGV